MASVLLECGDQLGYGQGAGMQAIAQLHHRRCAEPNRIQQVLTGEDIPGGGVQ